MKHRMTFSFSRNPVVVTLQKSTTSGRRVYLEELFWYSGNVCVVKGASPILSVGCCVGTCAFQAPPPACVFTFAAVSCPEGSLYRHRYHAVPLGSCPRLLPVEGIIGLLFSPLSFSLSQSLSLVLSLNLFLISSFSPTGTGTTSLE